MTQEAIVCVSRNQVWCDLGEEVAILHLGSGLYYQLAAVGARIWTLLQEPRSIAELRDLILSEYEIDLPRSETDLATFLQELAAADLIEVGCAPAR